MARSRAGASGSDSCLEVTAQCLLQGKTAQAEEFLDLMESGNKAAASKVFYHSLIHRCAQAGNPEAAGWCMERMVRRRLRANAVTFNSIIDACARVGNVALAAKWFDMMGKANLQPNGITYNTMIKACAKARDPARASWWLRRMQQDGVLPCIVTFSTMVDALAKNGDVEQAEAWYDRMRAAGVQADAVIFNTMINACAKGLKPEKAEEWLRAMEAQGLQPDEKTYNSLLNACTRVGDLQRAEHWFRKMEERGCRGDAMIFGCLVHACAKAGSCERAEYWVEEMVRRGLAPNAFCLNTLLQACALRHDHARAAKWFVHLLVHEQADESSFHSMVEVFASCGDLATAERWLHKMLSSGYNASHLTFSTLLRAAGSAGARASSPAQWAYAGGAGARVADPIQWAYEAIIRAYCKLGSVPPMRHWLVKMSSAGVAPTHSFFEECLRIASAGGFVNAVPEIQKMAHAAMAVEGSVMERDGPKDFAGMAKHLQPKGKQTAAAAPTLLPRRQPELAAQHGKPSRPARAKVPSAIMPSGQHPPTPTVEPPLYMGSISSHAASMEDLRPCEPMSAALGEEHHLPAYVPCPAEVSLHFRRLCAAEEGGAEGQRRKGYSRCQEALAPEPAPALPFQDDFEHLGEAGTRYLQRMSV